MYAVCYYSSPLGRLTLFAEGGFLTGLYFDNQRVDKRLLAGHDEPFLPVFEETYSWLDRYFSGVNPGPVPSVRFSGSLFQRKVWKILQQIPYGSIMTYGQIADLIATERSISRMSAQAVGGAVGHNPVGIIVPCHRVIGAHGALIGYAGGLDRKEALLQIEGIDLKRFDALVYKKASIKV